VPNQGRLGVFLAKEIIRLHRGEIHAGPGLEGTEILISLRSL
jgi:signal transduction histidine kinase